MITEEEFNNAIKTIKEYRKQMNTKVKNQIIDNLSEDENPTLLNLFRSERINARCYNSLCSFFEINKEIKIKDIEKLDLKDIILSRGFGKKSMKKLYNVCKDYNIKLNYSTHYMHIRGVSIKEFSDIIN